MGEKQVVYQYAIAPGDPRHSLWLLNLMVLIGQVVTRRRISFNKPKVSDSY